jgi:hypothetical protein
MHKRIFVLLLLCFSCGANVIQRDSGGRRSDLVPRPDQLNGVKKRIIILPFVNESPYGGDDLAFNCTEELKKELNLSGQYLISSDQVMSKDSKEIYAGGGLGLATLAKKAKLLGMNFLVYGRIISAQVKEQKDEVGIVRKNKSYAESKIEIRLYDVMMNKEVLVFTSDGNAADSHYRFFMTRVEEELSYRQELLRYAVKIAVRRSMNKMLEMANRIDWTGRVAKVMGSRIYVNAGKNSGIQVGDVLKILTEGEEIFDPESGAFLGNSQGEVKGTLEVIDYFGDDGTIAIIHSGGSVQEGDYVRLY